MAEMKLGKASGNDFREKKSRRKENVWIYLIF